MNLCSAGFLIALDTLLVKISDKRSSTLNLSHICLMGRYKLSVLNPWDRFLNTGSNSTN